MVQKRKMKHLLGVVPKQTIHNRRRRETAMQQARTRQLIEVIEHCGPPVSGLDTSLNETEPLVGTHVGDEVSMPHHQCKETSIDIGSADKNQLIFSLSTDDETEWQDQRLKVKRKKGRLYKRSCPAPPDRASSSSEEGVSVTSSGTSEPEPNDLLSDKESEEPKLKADDRKFFPGRVSDEEPLCPCTDITAGDVIFMVLNLGLRHNLSWDAQVDILKMVNTIVGGEKIVATKYLFLKQFEHDTSSISSHIFCNKCEVYIGLRETISDNQTCEFCGSNINSKNTDNFFVSLSISSQFKNFTKDVTFLDKILNYKSQRQQNTSESSDILDGVVYRNLSANGGILSSRFNFSYTFFTDGVQYGETSNKTIWPIYLTLNELPYEYRSKYLILAGLYAGPKDPSLKYFMKPFVNEANKLSKEGITWNYKGELVTSRLIPLCCIADAPARSKLLNYQSYSAVYGCTFCYHTSQRASGGQRFLVQQTPAELRTQQSLAQDINEVYIRRNLPDPKERVYRGVKGLSPLMSLDYFDMNCNVVVDYMHAIALGVVKHHIHLICDARYKKVWVGCDSDQIMGIDHIIQAVDERIIGIQSNSSIFRVLRPLKDRAVWRAKEYKAWLLFYALPCLYGLMKPKYLHHFSLLSKACYMMLQKSLRPEDISEIHTLLLLYSEFMQKYFGEGNMRYNVHLLSHIARGIENYGPVWSHNSFLYEAQNRYLRQMGKSASLVILDIAKKFLVYKSIPFLCQKMVSSERAVLFTDRMLHYKRVKKFFKFDDSCVLLGTGIQGVSEEVVAILGRRYPQYDASTCRLYERMVLRGTLFSTAFYSQGKQNNDSCALTAQGRFIILRHILHFGDSDVVLVVENLKESRYFLRNELTTINHLRKIERSNQLDCISYEDVSKPSMLISVPSGLYVSAIPYGCTIE